MRRLALISFALAGCSDSGSTRTDAPVDVSTVCEPGSVTGTVMGEQVTAMRAIATTKDINVRAPGQNVNCRLD